MLGLPLPEPLPLLLLLPPPPLAFLRGAIASCSRDCRNWDLDECTRDTPGLLQQHLRVHRARRASDDLHQRAAAQEASRAPSQRLPGLPRAPSFPSLGPAHARLGPPTRSEGRQYKPIPRIAGRGRGRLRSSCPPQAEACLLLRSGCKARAAGGFLVCLDPLERGKRGSRQDSRERWCSGSNGMGRV